MEKPQSSPEPMAVNGREAARQLSISRRKLHDLTFPNGPIRSFRVGSEHRYLLTELRRYAQEEMEAQGA